MITTDLLTYIHLANPWLKQPGAAIFANPDYIPRLQARDLLKPAWHRYITILTGPRQAGKTTLGRYICQQLVEQKQFPTVLYLNCDEVFVRTWLTGSHILQDIEQLLHQSSFILFLDEIQRLYNPGLLLKTIYDLKRPCKIIATGSSQLEIKRKVQEHLTGRHIECTVLPFSAQELKTRWDMQSNVLYGCYPDIVLHQERERLLSELYQNYINKDIIEILKIRYPDVMQQLLALIAHSAGQLVNYDRLATECKITSPTIQHYLSILEHTYVLKSIKPFVGNKRTEITSNPIYYFIDNGFRNQALNNFSFLENRTDIGLLIQGYVFQELYKIKLQEYLTYDIHYWRTKGGAEVDFVLSQGETRCLPIEVKYRHSSGLSISRGYRSFLQAYHPEQGLIITKDHYGEIVVEKTKVTFIPFQDIINWTAKIAAWMVN